MYTLALYVTHWLGYEILRLFLKQQFYDLIVQKVEKSRKHTDVIRRCQVLCDCLEVVKQVIDLPAGGQRCKRPLLTSQSDINNKERMQTCAHSHPAE